MSAVSHMRGIGEIVGELQGRLVGIEFPDEPGVKAFDRVELFDSEDLTAAFQFLLITEQRVCVIVPLEAKFEQVFPERGAASRKLTSKREVPVVVLCSDRVLGDRRAALYGSDTEHGAYALAELALPVCVGLLLPNPNGVVGEAVNYSVLTVKDSEQGLPSRVAVAVEVNCRGGWLEADLGRSPIL